MPYARKDLRGNVTDMCTVPVELKTIKDAGVIAGYASVFDVVDYHADVIMPGAFAESLRQLEDPGVIPILWQHDPEQRIGYATVLYEDALGLYIEAQLLLYHERALEVYNAIKMHNIQAMSIGYQVRSCFESEAGVRYLQAVQLKEVSIVLSPANEHAQILSVKGEACEQSYQPSADIIVYRNLMRACSRALGAVNL